MALTSALLLLFASPLVQCSPHMLNARPAAEHSLAQGEAEHHQKHKVNEFSRRYRNWEAQNAAQNAGDVEKANEDEARIFEQGKRLKQAEAEFHKKLDTCKQGDAQCHRRVIAEELRAQRMRAMPKHHSNGMEVTDAMGRSMPMLFNGHPQPFKAAASGVASSLFFVMVAVAGLVN